MQQMIRFGSNAMLKEALVKGTPEEVFEAWTTNEGVRALFQRRAAGRGPLRIVLGARGQRGAARL